MKAMSPVRLGSRAIGDGHPIFVMADVGLTNGGDVDHSMELINIASDLGVDAIKFQMIGPDVLLGDKTVEYTYPTLNDGNITENMYEMFSALTYSDSEWQKIADYARAKGLEFICTAHYLGAVAKLEALNVALHKICTWSLTHKRLIQAIGRTCKPLMLDTGAVTTTSLLELMGWHAESGGRGAIILHDFHTTDFAEMNFQAIPYMKQLLGCPVGYTPQGRDTTMDFMSVGLGVNVLEKRLTLSRGIPKNGHIKALEPDEFRSWLQDVRNLERAQGIASVLPTRADMEQSRRYFKSLYLKEDAAAGQVLEEHMLEARRPGTGISARRIDSYLGRRLARSLKAEHMLCEADFQ